MAFPKFSLVSKSTVLAIGLTMGVVPFYTAATNAAENQQGSTGLQIIVDRAKVVRIAKAADTIIVGNPSIVDATIQDARTIVLTGRNYGVTNLIVLDADGDAIVDETVIVKSSEQNTVRIFRQSVRETLSCSPVCESVVAVGDYLPPADSLKSYDRRFSIMTGQVEFKKSQAEGNTKDN